MNSEISLWIFINIFIPVAFPLLLPLLGLIVESARAVTKEVIVSSIEDGQLLWVAMALGAAGCYETGAVLQVLPKDVSNSVHYYYIFVIILFVILLIFSVSLVLIQAYGAATQKAQQNNNQGPLQNIPPLPKDKAVQHTSVIITFVVSLMFIFVHSHLYYLEQDEKNNMQKNEKNAIQQAEKAARESERSAILGELVKMRAEAQAAAHAEVRATARSGTMAKPGKDALPSH